NVRQPLAESSRTVVPVRVRAAYRTDELAGGAGDPSGGGESEGLGRQPHTSRREGAKHPDERVGNLPTPGTWRRRLPESDTAFIRQRTHVPTRAATGTLNKYGTSSPRRLSVDRGLRDRLGSSNRSSCGRKPLPVVIQSRL